MAALCGPTNALTALQKHTTADRSHQQQRFRAAPGAPSQGFRTPPPPVAAAWNDAEFENFAATGQVQGAFVHHHHHHQDWAAAQIPVNSPHHHQHQGFSSPPPQPQLDWASDFQRLEISAQQQQQPQPQSQNWALEFAQRLEAKSQPMSFSSAPAQNSYMGMGMGATVQQQQEEFMFDDSAFEQAFASAEREVADFFAERPETTAPVPEPFVEEKEKGKEKEKEREGDELARTAGQLLDSVQENTSAKFRNSNFLALMRRIRDREVVVEGNDMVERKE